MRKYVDMTEGRLLPKIIRFAIPIILSGMLQLAFNAADLIVVSRFSQSGSAAAGAVGVNSSLINLLVNFFIGIGSGAGIVTARAIGEKNNKKISETVHTAMLLAFIAGLGLTAVGMFGSGLFLTWMKTPQDLFKLASTYLRIYFTGATASLIYNFGAAILRASGDSRRPLIFITLAGILNVILNLVFVAVFKLDVAGVALATAISNVFSAALVLLALKNREDATRLYFGDLRIHKDRLWPILKSGAMLGVADMLFSIANVSIQTEVNGFGEKVVSGVAAGTNLESFVHTAMSGFTFSSLNFTAQNMGARKYDRAKKSIFLSMLCAVAVGGVFGPLVYHFSPQLLKIYIADDPEKITYGVIKMSYICRFYAILAVQNTISSGMRGLGMNKTPTAIAVLTVCVFRLIWIHTVFQMYHTPDVIYMSIPISWFLALVPEVLIVLIGWKRIVASNERTLAKENAGAKE